jgi:hypothetical protein
VINRLTGAPGKKKQPRGVNLGLGGPWVCQACSRKHALGLGEAPLRPEQIGVGAKGDDGPRCQRKVLLQLALGVLPPVLQSQMDEREGEVAIGQVWRQGQRALRGLLRDVAGFDRVLDSALDTRERVERESGLVRCHAAGPARERVITCGMSPHPERKEQHARRGHHPCRRTRPGTHLDNGDGRDEPVPAFRHGRNVTRLNRDVAERLAKAVHCIVEASIAIDVRVGPQMILESLAGNRRPGLGDEEQQEPGRLVSETHDDARAPDLRGPGVDLERTESIHAIAAHNPFAALDIALEKNVRRI